MSEGQRVVRADAAERARRAWEMRLAGSDWERIALATGYSTGSNAARAVKRHLDGLPVPDREEMRAVLRQRAEWLWSMVAEDVEARRSGAARAAVALLQRMAVAEGTDAPTRVEVTPDVQKFEAVVTALVAARRGTNEPDEVDVVEYAEIEDEDPTAED